MAGSAFELSFGVSRIIGGRKHQEDEYTCYSGLKQKGAALFAVFDGHGTDDYSACASDTLHKQILESQLFINGEYREAIKAGFASEDKLLMERVNAKRGGSTSTVAVVVGEELYIGHLGDSRAVLAVQDKPLTHNFPKSSDFDLPVRAMRISRDHRPDDPEERKRIIEAGGIVLQGRIIGRDSAINMSRALGDFDFKLPRNHARADFISSTPYVPDPIKLTPQCRFIVLGSDGLWDQLEERTVISLIDNLCRQGMSPTDIADTITGRLGGSNSYDNVTILIVFFMWKNEVNKFNNNNGGQKDEEIISSHESKVRVAP